MGSFFHGWRRKAGALTLGLALLFCGGSIRSSKVCDVFQVRITDSTAYVFRSEATFLVWQSVRDDKQPQNYLKRICFYKGDLARHLRASRRRQESEFSNLQNSYCFSPIPNLQLPDLDDLKIKTWLVPYWTVVAPLTLVSAWLLIANPKQKRSAPVVATGV